MSGDRHRGLIIPKRPAPGGVTIYPRGLLPDNWISGHRIMRNGQAIDTVAKGAFYFDHSADADAAARYQVRAVDGSGNLSVPAEASGPSIQPSTVFDDRDQAIRYHGTWQRQGGLQAAHSETLSFSGEKGAALDLLFEGKRILWFSRLGDNCGRAEVRIDDGASEVIDTYCSDDVWGVCVYRQGLSRSGPHRIQITVLGEHNPRAKGGLVHIDGLRSEPE
jgi:hypothetical protein